MNVKWHYLERLKSWTKARIKRLTATTSKTAIATLSATILIWVVSATVFKSVRYFSWSHPGILLVVFAVTGEVICDWNRKKNLKERLKKFFGFLLVAGLLLEVAEAIKSDRDVSVANLEAKQAEKAAAASYENAAIAKLEAGQANERAALIESNNLVLQKELDPRIITMEQITNFIFLTEKIQKIPIGVKIGESHGDTFNYAWQIKQMLTQAGFKTPDNDTNFVMGIRTDPTAIIFNITVGNKYWPDLDFMWNTTNDLENYKFRFEAINGFSRPIVSEQEMGDTNVIFAAIYFCFRQIGITNSEVYSKPDWINPGQYQIFVDPKP